MRWIPGTYGDTTTKEYAETRRWILENPNDGFHGDWKDWPIGRGVDGRPPS